MMQPKEKITLTKEQATLLIPLYAKGQPNPIIDDPQAREILSRVDYDFSALNVPEKTAVTLRMRAKQLDTYARDFLQNHPHGVVLHLGCGLDSRCLRVDFPAYPQASWFDLDLPEVIALRSKFYPQTPAYHLLPSSAADLSWLAPLDFPAKPVLVLAEGLLMYLAPEDVRALVIRLHDQFPGARLAFDAFSQMTADRVGAHPSLNKTGAAVRWGIDDPHDIEGWASGIRLREEWFFSQSADISHLGGFYRFMFALTAHIAVAQKAHRILDFDL